MVCFSLYVIAHLGMYCYVGEMLLVEVRSRRSQRPIHPYDVNTFIYRASE